MVKLFLDNVNNKPNIFNTHPYCLLVEKLSKHGKSKTIKFIDDNYIFKYSEKSLQNACRYNHFEIAKIILKYVKPNDDILINAYNKNNYNIVVLLIEYGLNVNVLKGHIKKSSRIKYYNDINNYLIENGLII